MSTNRLTVSLVDLMDDPVGVEVVVTLPEGTQALPDADTGGRQVVPLAVAAHSNTQGVAKFDLLPTAELVGQPEYALRVASGRPFSFSMPAQDTTLYELQTAAVQPPPAAVIPPLPPARSVLYYDNGWTARPVSSRSATAPTSPQQGDIWVDTSAAPPHERRWSGTSWEDIVDPLNIAGALNSLAGTDRVSGRHIAWPLNPGAALSALPPTADYEVDDFIWAIDSAGGSTDPSLYYLHSATTQPTTNRNRFVFTVSSGRYTPAGTASDNYRDALGEFQVDAGRGVIEVALDTGMGVNWPDALWVEGVGTTRLRLNFREAVPYTVVAGRRYKNYFLQTPVEPSGEVTLTLFSAISGANPYNFKPATTPVSPTWTQVVGQSGGGVTTTARQSTLTPSLAATTLTNGAEVQIGLVAGTIVAGHPITVAGNTLTVSPGTAAFQAAIDGVLAVQPNPTRTDGGARIFFDTYLKLGGTILPLSRRSHYVRATSPWSPQTWYLPFHYNTLLAGGDDLTLFIVRTTAVGTGNETEGVIIPAAGSILSVTSTT